MSDKMREEFEKEFNPCQIDGVILDDQTMAYMPLASHYSISLAKKVAYFNQCWGAWRLAWQAARTVPEGYVVVPVEPTPEMIDAVLRYADGDDLSFYGADELRKEVKHDWALMLSAAPEGKK